MFSKNCFRSYSYHVTLTSVNGSWLKNIKYIDTLYNSYTSKIPGNPWKFVLVRTFFFTKLSDNTLKCYSGLLTPTSLSLSTPTNVYWRYEIIVTTPFHSYIFMYSTYLSWNKNTDHDYMCEDNRSSEKFTLVLPFEQSPQDGEFIYFIFVESLLGL